MASATQDSAGDRQALDALAAPRRPQLTTFAGTLLACACATALSLGAPGDAHQGQGTPASTAALGARATHALADEAGTEGAGQAASEAEQLAAAIQGQSSPVTDAVPSEIQQRVEDSAAAYNEAVAARQQVESQIADTQARIDELEAALPGLQERAADAIAASYKYQLGGGGLLELILSSESFDTFASTLAYLNAVQDANTSQIEALLSAQAELAQQRQELDAAMQQAQQAEDAAATALAEAQAAREEAIRQAEEAARRAAEQEAARQAQAAARAQAAQQAQAGADAGAGAGEAGGAGETATGGGNAGVDGGGGDEAAAPSEEPSYDVEEPSGGGDGGSVDWSSDRDAFVAQWAGRIDAYLAGSPMAGQGATFAAAAWDFGIDPRWSPAIAYVESSLGAYCFLPYNAWGWGSASWGSWEEAIYAQVAGLARGYGPTFDYSDALSYCPPNADEWYYSVLNQMNSI